MIAEHTTMIFSNDVCRDCPAAGEWSRDQRCVCPDLDAAIVHFAVSQPDQVERIARLGATVSGNPYYVTMLADKHGTVGLGPERADAMALNSHNPGAGVHHHHHGNVFCALNRALASSIPAGWSQ